MAATGPDIDQSVERILNGEGLEVTGFDSVPVLATPVALRKTVCYIVCAIIFNEKREVLMVQEAKSVCYGRWYLPAGRMEMGESILEALCREVHEEAGLQCQPITMLLIQEQGPQWIRITFLATATGGHLKSVAEADAESLQADWWDRESPLPLRSRDILPLIQAGLTYLDTSHFPVSLPVDLPCPLICQRLLLTFTPPADPHNHDGVDQEDSPDLWLLLSDGDGEGGRPRLPVAVAAMGATVTGAARRLALEVMPSWAGQLSVCTHGVLGLQHNGRVAGQTDGVCFNMLLSLESGHAQPPPPDSQGFRWGRVANQSLREKILQRMGAGSLLPIHSL